MDKNFLKKHFEKIKSEQESNNKDVKKYPSAPQMVKNLAQSVVNNIQSVIHGNSLKLPDAEADKRLNICKSCEFFDASQVRCTKCGCKMAVKTYLKAEKCPIGKW